MTSFWAAVGGAALLLKALDIPVAIMLWRREDRKSRETVVETYTAKCEDEYKFMSDCAIGWETSRRNTIIETRCSSEPRTERQWHIVDKMTEALDCYLGWLESLRRTLRDQEFDDLARTLEGLARDLHEDMYDYLCSSAKRTEGFVPSSGKHDEALKAVRLRFDLVQKGRALVEPRRAGLRKPKLRQVK